MNRLAFLKTLGGTAALAVANPLPGTAHPTAYEPGTARPADAGLPIWPVPDLKKAIADPILLSSVALLKTVGQWWLVVTDSEGRQGITQCNGRMMNTHSLLKGLVVKHFVGKDARELPQLVDNAYRLDSNYKYAGMPLWNCIGTVEIAVWDLLGKVANKPVYALLGQPVRADYAVYVSDFYRGGEPVEAVVDRLAQKLTLTGATGVKLKLGGRMMNTPDDEQRTRTFVPMVRKKLGDNVTIYADGNGSYSVREGIETGRFLESYGVEIFEEPCNFEDEEGLRQVNKALTKLILAGGEQDTSLYRFERLARTSVYDLLQPDLNYNGGILRALQVAQIATTHGKHFAPHTPKADPMIAPFWHMAAVCPNLYGLQEFVYNIGEKPPAWFTPTIRVQQGRMAIPTTPGLGIQYDEDIWKGAERVA